MCYSAKAVANAFIKVAKEEKLPLSNLVLQKLVFLAHGWYLGITKKPLTYDAAEAWRYGPVFPNLYKALVKYGADNVEDYIPAKDEIDKSEIYNFIKAVFNKYGQYTPGQLIEITHMKKSPWSQVWREGEGKNLQISNNIIMEYYAQKIKTAEENAQ